MTIGVVNLCDDNRSHVSRVIVCVDSLEELDRFDGVDEALKETGRLLLTVEHVGQASVSIAWEGWHRLSPFLPTHTAATARVLQSHDNHIFQECT